VIENVFGGIVLTAQSFNPSIFTEAWLIENQILPQDSLTGPRVYSPEIAQFQTPHLQVLVIPPKMQVLFGLQAGRAEHERATNIMVRTVQLLPQTPYQALGLNFDHFASPPDKEEFGAFDRRLLGSGDYALLGEFSGGDARFGRYLSKDFGDWRLRLDIKPVTAGPDNRELLQFSFNFHHDVSHASQTERSSELVRVLGMWESLRAYSDDLVKRGTQQ